MEPVIAGPGANVGWDSKEDAEMVAGSFRDLAPSGAEVRVLPEGQHTQTTWFRDGAGIGTDPRAREARNPTSSCSAPRGILPLRTKSFSLWASRALPGDDSFPGRSDR